MQRKFTDPSGQTSHITSAPVLGQGVSLPTEHAYIPRPSLATGVQLGSAPTTWPVSHLSPQSQTPLRSAGGSAYALK